jgi:hypothetical protein
MIGSITLPVGKKAGRENERAEYTGMVQAVHGGSARLYRAAFCQRSENMWCLRALTATP